VEVIFYDRELVADLLTRYYTDNEPGSLWIGEVEDKVVGYLSGCLNSRFASSRLKRSILPRVLLKGISRGALTRWDTWRVLGALLQTLIASLVQPTFPSRDYPTHLHINLLRDYRGLGIGERLVNRFIDQVRTAGFYGIHVNVRADNLPARRFFEQQGFIPLLRFPYFLPRAGKLLRTERIIYVREI